MYSAEAIGLFSLKKAARDEVWKNNFQRENNEELTKAPREFILFFFFFSFLVIATEEPGTEMTSLSQGTHSYTCGENCMK